METKFDILKCQGCGEWGYVIDNDCPACNNCGVLVTERDAADIMVIDISKVGRLLESQAEHVPIPGSSYKREEV